MIRNHIAQRPRRVVITAAQFDAELFGDRNLHVVNKITVPNRLENAVAETKN